MNGEQFFEILGKAIFKEDEDTLSAMIAENFVLYQDEGLPYGGEYHGKEGFARIRYLVFTIWRDRTIERVSVIGSEKDQSFSLVLRMSGKLGSTDAISETFVSEVWNVRDGKARWARVWYSNADLVSEHCRERYERLVRNDMGDDK